MKLPKINLYYIVSFLTLAGIVLSVILSLRFLLNVFDKAFMIDERAALLHVTAFDMDAFERVKERMGW